MDLRAPEARTLLAPLSLVSAVVVVVGIAAPPKLTFNFSLTEDAVCYVTLPVSRSKRRFRLFVLLANLAN